MSNPMPRRQFLSQTAASAAALLASRALGAPEAEPVTARSYLAAHLYTRAEVDDWLAGRAFPFAKYSSDYGWLLRSAKFQDGMDDSICVYTYGTSDERITINYRDRPCRINTYGNSFTQCHQVSDGETWQEALAAHLHEPVRNFGVGGWSVYQAYLRMMQEEKRHPADYIIFNIYEDDHFRNLDAWRNLRAKKHIQFIEPTLPHVRVNARDGRFEECPNPCPTPESVYHLCDLDWVCAHFEEDFALQILLAHLNAKMENPDRRYAGILALATTHGIVTREQTAANLSATADELHRRSAYFASERIVEKIEAFAAQTGKRVLYVVSYSPSFIARHAAEGVRPDQSFIDFMRAKKLPLVDLLAGHAAELAHYSGDIKDYLKHYFVGHYNPRGNLFTALALKDALVAMLEPKPPAYRADPDVTRWK
ncbi:hypothetical protein K0B96_14895 [Horticoccus luteus]|uniref:SGNH/GDSL hydrolase family protein n=1 Tax=Horticoccus luteus TaxID=2862869 RepID=A0A8F9TT46_9BACT|nr:hypothetical protein [Horticoccus luteus]QYM78570.1 hypothetical protein K0B96_14895 [Horticoccus luteus]